MPIQDQIAALPRLTPIVALLLVALLVSAVFFLALPNDTLWQRVVEDAGHGPVFAGIAMVVLLLRRPASASAVRPIRHYRDAFVAAVVIGIVTELVQSRIPGRDASLMDVLHDAAGAALGLCALWLAERWRARRRGAPASLQGGYVAIAVALSALTVLAWPLLQCARAYAVRTAAAPTLLPLAPPADTAFVLASNATASAAPLPARYRRAGDAMSLRLEFAGGSQPGVQLTEPMPDWSRYAVLNVDITNPSSQSVPVVLRIVDAKHDWTNADRFNQSLTLPGATRATIRIALESVAQAPRARRMDMNAIADVMLFADRPLAGGRLFVTRVWLE